VKKSFFFLTQVLVSASLVAESAAPGPRVLPKAAGVACDASSSTSTAPRTRGVDGARAAEAAATAAVPVTATPAVLSDVAARLSAARAAARSPERVASPTPEIEAAPLAARVGRDVEVVVRPGVGTPMQIRGERLQLRRAAAEPGEDDDLATAREFLRANRRILLLDDPDLELATQKRTEDELGFRHIKFDQRFRGLAVWPNQVIVHLDRDSTVYLMDGAFVPTPRLISLKPIVDSKSALRIARRETGAADGGKATAPELFIYAPGTRPARLAWKVVVSPSVTKSWIVVVDAVNGARLTKISRVQSEGLDGSGVDTNGLTRSLHVFRATNGKIYMIDTSKAMYDPTSQPPDYEKSRGVIFVYDAANTPDSSDPDSSDATWYYETSTDPNSWDPPDAVSASFALSYVYDYYKDTHGRNSIDGKGGTINGLVRLGSNFENAFWSSSENAMFFGDGDNYVGSLDVVGHELTHGVTDNTAGLIYQDQSGAMNEAMSDIFGEMVEAYTYGSLDWIHGSSLSNSYRNMADPASHDQPGTMSDYVNTDSDEGGVHTNSGIINHAYYYLAEGLNGAIGTGDSEKIFYRALTVHLTQNSQFLDLRLAAIQSADELFGHGSVQSQRVGDAFDNVEILAATPAPPPDASPVNSADSTFFVARGDSGLRLARRESAKGDPAQGDFISSTLVAEERPSVSGDGSLAFFVNAENDGCFIATAGGEEPSCLGLPGSIASVAMSRDGERYGFVLLDGNGDRENRITVVDLPTSQAVTYELVSAPTDGGTPAGALYADAMDFTANKRFLLYDALHQLDFEDGSSVGLWSISALDFSTGNTYAIVPPFTGVDIGFPSVAHASDEFYTFEVTDQTTGKADIYAANLSTGAEHLVVTGIGSGPTVPNYTGDDRAIVYSYPDSSAATGRSLAREGLAADHVTASGSPANWIFDGEYGVVYRRGSYAGPSAGCVSNATTLCLAGGRFQVGITFTTNAGEQGSGKAVSLTSDTGYFTFFDPTNVEVVVKVLDACGLSQRFWVFAGGLTNVATVMSVTDTLTGVSRTYTNPQNTAFQPVQETKAFNTCFAPGVSAGAAQWQIEAAASAASLEVSEIASAFSQTSESDPEGGVSIVESEDLAAATAACTENASTLCLSNGRFKVQASWRTSDGRSGNGNGVRLSTDTGYFWFFTSSNVELVVKVLNACSFSDHYWTFAGGLTSVQVTMTVTDTQTGATKTYTNPLNRPFQPIQDAAAFSSCP
jgi:bacillolysin